MKFMPLRLVYLFFARFFRYICLPVAAAVMLTGCAAIQVKLGMRVYLNKIPITSIQAKQGDGNGMAPGEKSPLIVTVIQPDGKVLTTEGKGHGKVLWKDLTVTASFRTSTLRYPAILTCTLISTFPWNMTASSPLIFQA